MAFEPTPEDMQRMENETKTRGAHKAAVDVLLLEIETQQRHLTEIDAGRAHHIQMAQTCQDRATATRQQIEDLKAAVRQLGGGQ